GALAVAGQRLRAASRPAPPARRREPDPADARTAVVRSPEEEDPEAADAAEAPTDVVLRPGEIPSARDRR
ncbi:MAG TPA: hypothetical protein VGO81_15640, partial [Solirubrobacteraceae bacterium]|nr:hypothetical protein [Solirubrobacteraceae bacterium]